MFPQALRTSLERTIGTRIIAGTPLNGGSINSAMKLEGETENYFLKWNDADRFPGMFEAEAKGLQLLAHNSTFCVPQFTACGTVENTSYLLLEFLDKGQVDWESAGIALANMHRQPAEKFGLDHDNYIGSLRQINTQHATWSDFFANERILLQVQLAVEKNLLTRMDRYRAENFCTCIDELFPKEAPALLHGDLWNGNFMFTKKGPSIYDPAVYYGHREMDLAMTKLFGGFDAEFYEAYNDIFPLEKNWQQRISYCNLYPLLVHVNLFGGGYVNEVRSILEKF